MIALVIHAETVVALVAFCLLAALFLRLDQAPAFRALARYFALMALGAALLLLTEFLPALARAGEVRPLLFRALLAGAPVLLLVEILWRLRR